MPKRIPETSLAVGGCARAWLGAAALVAAGASAGCEERVSLGAWAGFGAVTSGAGAAAGGNGGESGSGNEPGMGGESTASAGEPSAAGTGGAETASGGTPPIPDAAAPTATPEDEFPECLTAGVPGAPNVAGEDVGATEMFSYWTLPEAVDSLEWDFMVEREVPARDEDEPPVGGYYWHQQFSFVQGVAARFGIQAEGIYRSDPLATSETTKMAVLWLSGPPLDAELGDIPYPDARVASETGGGASWQTIHAKFDWQACTRYRFRFGPESTDADGNIWYGAWIDDVDAADSLLLGRMLLPPDVGLLSPFSISRSSPIDFGVASCRSVPPMSALFGSPRSADGSQVATLATNRFLDPERCDTSRFSEFPSAVRHEVTE